MRVSPDYLTHVTAPFADPEVGIVTCLYRGIAAGGIWSDLASLHVNHGFLPQAVVGRALALGNGCFGATIALRAATLDAIGGFGVVADKLADDHALGEAVTRTGLRLQLSPHLIDNLIAEPGLGALFRHELRWALTVRVIAPSGFAGSLVTQPVVLALLALAFGAAPWVLVIASVSRCLTVWLTDRSLVLKPSPWWLLPLRDLLSFAVFVASFFIRSVAWRDHSFRISRTGRLTLDGDLPA